MKTNTVIELLEITREGFIKSVKECRQDIADINEMIDRYKQRGEQIKEALNKYVATINDIDKAIAKLKATVEVEILSEEEEGK